VEGLVLGLQPLLPAIVFSLLLSLGQMLSALLLHAMVEFLRPLLKVGLALLQQIGHVGVVILLHTHQAIASLNSQLAILDFLLDTLHLLLLPQHLNAKEN
jgi:hypothetical protein